MAADCRDEIAASVAAVQELGSGYDQALAEGLVERIGAEIDQRIAAEIGNLEGLGGLGDFKVMECDPEAMALRCRAHRAGQCGDAGRQIRQRR